MEKAKQLRESIKRGSSSSEWELQSSCALEGPHHNAACGCSERKTGFPPPGLSLGVAERRRYNLNIHVHTT